MEVMQIYLVVGCLIFVYVFVKEALFDRLVAKKESDFARNHYWCNLAKGLFFGLLWLPILLFWLEEEITTT